MKTTLMYLFVVWLLAICPARGAEEKDKPLTNVDVIKMLGIKLPESVIIAKINASKVKFDTSTDALIELHKKNVSEKVLLAILSPKGATSEETKSAGPNTSAVAKQPDSLAPPPAASTGERPDTLSAGAVTGFVKKGVTTQLQLLELFGGPSVTTTDKDGTEVWMYDKTTSTVTGASAQTGTQTRKSEASVMAGFFGIPLVGGVGGAKGSERQQSTQSSQSTGTVSRSVKTITFIIKFNTDKTVKEYSVRQASF